MPTDQRAELAKIKRLDQLIPYLRDEMGWPISKDSFEDADDLFYEFSPDELGIDPKTAAKIESIRRLRPLSTRQPWGIFFVKFEPKRLPVVALRRLLSQVALKKRASANSAERAAWAVDDLLFVSNYGEGDERQITFAHFSQPETKHDLPTLRVLGWDNLDTLLHLDNVAETLSKQLAWPDDEEDVAGWRDAWSSAFTLTDREVITTSRDLSIRLAKLARAIRDRIRTALAIETEAGPLTQLMKAFQEALVHDLDARGFADMYAQTIAYGLLSARIANPTGRSADDVSVQMPVTNPFLKELMETFLHVGGRHGKAGGPGIDFDELGVSEVVALLDRTNMEAVVRDFGDRNPREDPVIHFYEDFLAAYDKKQKVSRGVFYTPRPVVSYIVRSVDQLLQTEFGLEDGLADTATWGEMSKRHDTLEIPSGVDSGQAFVQILDPATGTGTFLVEVIDLIYRRMAEKWKAAHHGDEKIDALWNDYVPKYLLPRLYGYELLMAPYAIAHLKIGLKLYETGYRFGSEERARIYLTNALEPPRDFSEQFEFAIPALAHEAVAVNSVKRHQLFTVVIGNPPYSKMSGNLSPDAVALIEPFRYVDGERIVVKAALAHELNLQDDYVKFFGLLFQTQKRAGTGVASYISNFGYLDSPSLRGLRWSLLQHATRLEVLNLGGRVADRKGDGGSDENVFDIEQGVAIAGIVKAPYERRARLRYQRLRGLREAKYAVLQGSSLSEPEGETLVPNAPYFRFVPSEGDFETEFLAWPALDAIFLFNSGGIITSRDNLVIGWTEKELVDRIERFAHTSVADDDAFKAEVGFSAKGKWDVAGSKAALRTRGVSGTDVKPLSYRPFDVRGIYYFPPLLDTPSRPVAEMVYRTSNLVLLAPRVKTTKHFCHIAVSRCPAETKCASHDRATQMFPIFRPGALDADALEPNIAPAFAAKARELGVISSSDDLVDVGNSVAAYAYAILHSPTYRTRYGDALRNDYPRVPLPADPTLARRLVELGGELLKLHLLEAGIQTGISATYEHGSWHYRSSKDEPPPLVIVFVGPARPVVEKVGWSKDSVWIDATRRRESGDVEGSVGFLGVPETLWQLQIGGYQVCEKWLKDRGPRKGQPGRTLAAADVAHYYRILIALHETIRIQHDIDEVIEQHGGWPGAFLTSGRSAAVV